ncbi:MAG TPA: TrkH family potassium uptake protein [Bacteroidales bacterium]|nr:TrkH family potassium uptake protein [Bacteroidales bacterium]
MKLINPLLILRLLSTILLIETASFLLCLPAAYIYRESPAPFYWSAGITLALSTLLFSISGNAGNKVFSNRDGYLSVTLSWILFLLGGTLPYIISGTIPSFIDAFFESCSGFTTTGSTIINDVESLPYSILFWRSLTHFIGGIGIIVLVIIVLPSLKMTGSQLFSLESSLQDKIHPKTKAIGLRILTIYLSLTLAEMLFLNLGGITVFESICYSFGTIATGGFTTKNDSLASYSSYIQYIIMTFMFLAGVSQVIFYHFFKRNFKKIKQNDELWFYVAATIIAGALMTFILLIETTRSPEVAFREGFFNVISILTTTGFTTTNFVLLPSAGVLLIFLLYFAGASTGSTSGSIKMARHLLVLKNIRCAFIRLVHPNAVSNVKINGRLLPEKTNTSILSYVMLYIMTFFLGTFLVIMTGQDVVTAASAVAASLGNVGPGLGTIGSMGTYAHLPEITKLILSLLMVAGRVEIITILVLFTRTFRRL